jgi:hypothetical protein
VLLEGLAGNALGHIFDDYDMYWESDLERVQKFADCTLYVELFKLPKDTLSCADIS